MNDTRRRDFLKKMSSIAFMGFGGGFSGCYQPSSPRSTVGKYIDVHVHIGHEWMKDEHLTVKNLLDWMDVNSVEKSVVHIMSPQTVQQSLGLQTAPAVHLSGMTVWVCAIL